MYVLILLKEKDIQQKASLAMGRLLSFVTL